MATSTSSSTSSDFVDVVNRFGFQLQCLTIEDERSTGLCAMNIYHCLMMVAAGSKENNLFAFSKVLGFNQTDLDVILRNVVQLESYSKGNNAVELSSASSLWHAKSFILGKQWKETMQALFGATVGPLESEPINTFIAKETNGKFKDLVKPSDLAGQLLMLITCLYFKAEWANPFDIAKTQKSASFYPFDNKPQTCNMMHKVDFMGYREDESMQACVLTYKSNVSNSSFQGSVSTSGPQWKAAVVLPKERGPCALKNILSSFSGTSSTIDTLIHGTASRKVALYLPRFKLQIHLELVDALAKLGLSPAFALSMGFAPISDMGPLMISRVTHDLVIEVNEEGTEMAAVTIVAMGRSRHVESITEMRVDRPFLFIVFDEVRKLVLCSVIVNSILEK